MASRRPRFGPVRQQIHDAARMAEYQAQQVGDAATSAILETSAQFLKISEKILDILEDWEKNGLDVQATTTFLGTEYKIPIRLEIDPGEEEDEGGDEEEG